MMNVMDDRLNNEKLTGRASILEYLTSKVNLASKSSDAICRLQASMKEKDSIPIRRVHQ